MPQDEGMGWILGAVTDLMFVVKIGDAAKRAGKSAAFAGTFEGAAIQLAKKPDLAIVDLACNSADPLRVIERAKEAGISTVAFGAHVDAEALRAARNAGADQVMPRSKFVRELERLVNGGNEVNGCAEAQPSEDKLPTRG